MRGYFISGGCGRGGLMLRAMLLSTGVGCLAPAQVQAQAAERQFDIPAQSLGDALMTFGRQSGMQVTAEGPLVEGRSSSAVSGRLSATQALSQLLAGSGLTFRYVGANAVRLERAPQAANGTIQLGPVRVEGNGDSRQNGSGTHVEETANGPVAGYLARRTATGTKTDTPVIETPQSISIVTADRIAAIGATTLRDALGYTPGVNISPYGSDSRFDWINLRGFSQFSPGHFLDGLQLRNDGSYGIWKAEPYGAERIEVLRGPSSVLYGQGSPGGMVNVVSKHPTREPLNEMQVQVGDHNRYQVAGDFSGPVDRDGKWLYRITGLLRDAELPLAHMPDDRIYVAPALTWTPGTGLSITVLSHYLRMRAGSNYRGYPEIGTITANPNGPIDRSVFLGEAGFNHYNHDQWMLGYRLEYRLSDQFTVRQNLRYGYLKTDYQDVLRRGSYLVVNAASPAAPENFRTINRVAFGAYTNARNFAVDNQVELNVGIAGTEHKVLAGVDYQRSSFDKYIFYGGTVTPLNLYAPTYGGSITIPGPSVDADQILKQTGLYLQDQVRLGGRIIITAGGRYDFASTDTDDHLGRRTILKSDRFSGRAGIVYVHPSGLAPYASYSESFTPTPVIDTTTGKPFAPETGRQYEVGIRYQPPGRNDSITASLFEVKRQNYITYDAVFTPKQNGEVTVRGFELEALLQPVAGMNLTGNYSWTPKADVTASARPAEIGLPFSSVSEHQFAAWADYKMENGLKFGAGVRYVGPNRGYGNTAAAQVPAYTLFDAMLGYQIGPWQFAVNARNLTDKSYIASCGSGSCYFGDPRSVIATIARRW